MINKANYNLQISGESPLIGKEDIVKSHIENFFKKNKPFLKTFNSSNLYIIIQANSENR